MGNCNPTITLDDVGTNTLDYRKQQFSPNQNRTPSFDVRKLYSPLNFKTNISRFKVKGIKKGAKKLFLVIKFGTEAPLKVKE